MKLKNYFKKTSEKRIKKLASKHRVYYQNGFSRNWIGKQIKEKLLDQEYLNDLITKELTSADKKILKKLLSTESISTTSIRKNNYQNLLAHGLIYERSNFCYLFKELKPLLQNIFSTSNVKVENKTTTTNTNIKKFKLKENTISTKKEDYLSFFQYLVLIIAQINKLDVQKNKTTIQKELLAFLNKINSTKLETEQLLDYILNYCYKQSFLTENFKIKTHFFSWLKTNPQEKIVTAINHFVPQSAPALRKIIAVLSHYPQDEAIPLSFAYQDLELEKMDFRSKELIKLLNVVTIKDEKLSLTEQGWQLFNPQIKFDFKHSKSKSNKIVVPTTTRLNELWEVANNNQLAAIEEKLIFRPLLKDQNTK